MSPEELEKQLVITRINVEEAGGKIVVKRGWFWKALHWIVFAVTLGQNRRFLTDYYTTIGPWIGVPEGWESRAIEGRIAVLEHERIHVEQCKRFGLGNVYLGFPLFTLLYLLCLPAGLAYFRWRFEREAYAHGINVKLYIANPAVRARWREQLINSAVKQLTTGLYAWTWPFPGSVRRYFERHTCPFKPTRFK